MDEAEVLGIIAGEGTNEEKTQIILAAHTTANSRLEVAEKKLLDEKKKLQATYEELLGKIEPERESYKTQIQELEEKIKKGGSEEAKAAFDAQLKREKAAYEADLAKIRAEADEAKKSLDGLTEKRNKDLVYLAVENAMTKLGVTDPEDRTNMRKAFLYDHEKEFKPGEDDDIPVNSEYKTVQEVMSTLAGTAQYKKFIPNLNTGGGATGATHGSPVKPNTMPRERFDKMSPQEKMDFATKGGTIV